MKHAILGGILLTVGLLLISPLDDLLILVPLSIYFNTPNIIIAFNAIAIVCLLGAIYLLGISKVTGPFQKNWKMAAIGFAVLIVALYVYMGL